MASWITILVFSKERKPQSQSLSTHHPPFSTHTTKPPQVLSYTQVHTQTCIRYMYTCTQSWSRGSYSALRAGGLKVIQSDQGQYRCQGLSIQTVGVENVHRTVSYHINCLVFHNKGTLTITNAGGATYYCIGQKLFKVFWGKVFNNISTSTEYYKSQDTSMHNNNNHITSLALRMMPLQSPVGLIVRYI